MKDVVVVGAGGMGRAWMDTIARRDDTRVSAVVDVDPAAARAATAERGGEIPSYSHVEDALAHAPADLLVNATIPEAHLAVSSAALRAGVPVLSEKPVTPTVQDALVLAALSEAVGVLLATSQSRRYSAGIRSFRDTLVDLGGAEQLNVRFFQNPRFGGFRDDMANPLLVDMAIHTFDQARFVLDAEPVSVYCEEFNPSWSWYRGGASAEAVFRFEDGCRFSYTGSWCSDGLTTPWNGAWRGAASRGSASWDGEDEVISQGRDGSPALVPVPPSVEGLDAALAEFVTALDGGPSPSGEIRRNVWSVAMVEAAVESARRDAPVHFDAVFRAAHERAAAQASAEGQDDVSAALAGWGGPLPG